VILLMTIEISHFTHCSDFGCVVVQFYPWLKFSFLLFSGMGMYGNNMMMSLKQKKIKFKPRIKLNHNRYINYYWCNCLCGSFS